MAVNTSSLLELTVIFFYKQNANIVRVTALIQNYRRSWADHDKSISDSTVTDSLDFIGMG